MPVIALRLLIFMCPEKKLTRGPEQYVSLIGAGVAGAAFSNTPMVILKAVRYRDEPSGHRYDLSGQADGQTPDDGIVLA